MPSEVLVQATRSGTRILLPAGAVSADALPDLARQLGPAPALAGEAVTLVPGGALTADDMTALETLLIGEHGAATLEVVRAAALEAAAARSDPVGARASPASASTAPRSLGSHAGAGHSRDIGGDSLLVRRTLRSGQRVHFAGNVVVLGDVNPGAEIAAGGDIVVMGTLRGVAHAGAGGDTEAVVAAFRLLPTQLRIGGVIGRAPDGAYDRPDSPEVARVRDGILVVERLQPSFGDLLAGGTGGGGAVPGAVDISGRL